MKYTMNDLNAMKGDALRNICSEWDLPDRSKNRTNALMVELIYYSDKNTKGGGKSKSKVPYNSDGESEDKRPTRSTTSSRKPQASLGMSKLEDEFAKLNTITKATAFKEELPNHAFADTPSFGIIKNKTAALNLAKEYGHTAPLEEYAMAVLSSREITKLINKVTAAPATPATSRVTTSTTTVNKQQQQQQQRVCPEVTSRRIKA